MMETDERLRRRRGAIVVVKVVVKVVLCIVVVIRRVCFFAFCEASQNANEEHKKNFETMIDDMEPLNLLQAREI